MRYIVAALLFLIPTIAVGQSSACGDYTRITEGLTNRWGEQLMWRGLTSSDTPRVAELWGSAETGSWTWVIVSPSGQACVATAGSDFLNLQLRFDPSSRNSG